MRACVDGVGTCHFAEAGQVGDTDIRDVLDEYRGAVVDFDDDVPDLVDIVEQADAADDVGLGVLIDNVAADIDIAFANGIEYIQRGDAEVGQQHRVDPDLIGLDPAAEADDVGYTGDGAQFAVDDPILDGLQFAGVAEAAFDGIAEYFAGRAGGRLDVGVDVVGQVGVVQEVVDLLAGIGIIDVIVEDELDDGEAEDSGGAEAGLSLNGVHGQFDRDGDELLYFFRASAGPLGDDGDLGVGDVGEGLDGHVAESEDAVN